MNVAPVVFFVSLASISIELFFGLILGLKTWSHMVYLVITFALLGLGVGTTLYSTARGVADRCPPRAMVAGVLGGLAISTVLSSRLLAWLPLTMKMILSWEQTTVFALVCGAVAFPFVGVGFLLAYFFSRQSGESAKLYGWDLAGAAAGAALFFPLVWTMGPFRSCALVSAAFLALGAYILCVGTGRGRIAATGFGLGAAFLGTGVAWPDPPCVADPGLGWEYIPGHFSPADYEIRASRWHPIGRTDVYRFKNEEIQTRLRRENFGALQINVVPAPELSYFSTNFRAGTPVYNLSETGMAKRASSVRLFSQAMEFSHLLLSRPRVLVIGTGGGRDIFMSKAHGATEVVGAEVNLGTFSIMSRGGPMFDYSGRIYEAPGVHVFNVDGRHLARVQPDGIYDLVILNGVDTFAALASGAYAYAENYLYTKEAISDYLRILRDTGMVNFNRWLEIGGQGPRETLRLLVMVYDALRTLGVKSPREHVIIGSQQGWGLMLVKKTPFALEEQEKILRYFAERDVTPVIAPNWQKERPDEFDQFVEAFEKGKEREFIKQYWADVSVVTDDSPFFYKYYRFRPWTLTSPGRANPHPASGDTVFYAQFLMLSISGLFILLFIFLPLLLFQRAGGGMAPRLWWPFLLYFALVGIGFIFIEIALMQKLTLLLGSPIYSISVTLASLLVFSGLGSLGSERLRKQVSTSRVIAVATVCVVVYLVLFIGFGGSCVASMVALPFAARALACLLIQLPIGLCLGMFFPQGLVLAGLVHPAAVAWAWGINFGFTVLGSILAMIIAQFLGFNTVFALAALAYALAGCCYWLLSRRAPGGSVSGG